MGEREIQAQWPGHIGAWGGKQLRTLEELKECQAIVTRARISMKCEMKIFKKWSGQSMRDFIGLDKDLDFILKAVISIKN